MIKNLLLPHVKIHLGPNDKFKIKMLIIYGFIHSLGMIAESVSW